MSQIFSPGGNQATVSHFAHKMHGGGTFGYNSSPGTVYFHPCNPEANVAMYRLHFLQNITSQSLTTFSFTGSVSGDAGSTGATGNWGYFGTALLFSRQSSGTTANSSNIISFYSNTFSYGVGYSATYSNSTNVSSMTLRFTTSAAASFISQIDGSGNITTGSSGTSNSSSFTSTTTAASTFSSTFIMSFASQVYSNIRALTVPFNTTLSAGEYWFAHLASTSSGSTNLPFQNICRPLSNPQMVVFTTNTAPYAALGNTATTGNTNFVQGWGSYGTSGNTTSTIPLTNISNLSQYQLWYNMVALTL